jgi:acetamidase/formamidase
MIHRVGHDHIHTYWSNELAPVRTVHPGDTVTFETLESSYGRVARDIATVAQPGADPQLLSLIAAGAYPERSTMDRQAHLTRGHPLTGPVAVEGASPGDTLVIEVLRIDPGPWGFTACSADPNRLGLLNDYLDVASYHHIWDLRGGEAEFKPGIRVPLAPFCGVMGVAPAEPGQHSTIPPGRHGGNLDLRHLTEGSTLHLPVLAPGALLSIGDVHAAQGDGEVCGTGIETDAVVTVRLDLVRDRPIRQPWVSTSDRTLSTPGAWQVSVGCEPTLREAARMAVRGILDHLLGERG